MQNEIDNESESENEVVDSTIMSRKALNRSVVTKLEIPVTIQQVISKIEQAQLSRARQDINMQLGDVMQSVQQIINRYTADENMGSGRRIFLTEYKKRRISLLEKIVTYANSAEIKEKTLVHILAWLEEWHAILSEMTAVDIDEHHRWIAQLEILPETFRAIESNVKILIGISASLLEEKKKQNKKITSRVTLWKSWKERVIKRPATAHALRPDQMISDEFATNTKVSEIQGMLQELIGTAMFNKLENNAIKYISSTIVNLSKALSALNNEVKLINLQSANMYINETSEREKELSLKIIQDLSEKNEMLQQKLQDAEEKCEQLIRSKVSTASPQSSMAISKADKEDSMESILAKQLENIVEEAQRKRSKASGSKRDSAISYTAQVEMTPDLIEQQSPLPEKEQRTPSEDITEDKVLLKKGDVYQKDGTDQYQSQKRKHTKGSYVHETSVSNLSEDKGKQIVSETKVDYHFEVQALEKKSKEIKSFSEAKSKSSTQSKGEHVPADFPSSDTKSQGGKSGTSSMWKRLRKVKLEYLLEKSQISSEDKEEPTTELIDRESKSERTSPTEPFKLIQLDHPSEKVKTKGKKQQISPGTITSKEKKTGEDTSVITNKFKSHELVKSQSRKTKETSDSTSALGSSDGKSEQSNLEEFQKAIMAFLKEKIDNIGKPSDNKTAPEKELLLKKAEVEKLEIIKAKMEEYFQNVAETVTKILRKYKDIKYAGQVGEKPMKQKKVISPGLHFQKPISAKSKISTLLSSESMDPVILNLIQTILTEIGSERGAPVVSIAGRDHKEKEKQRRGKYLQEGQEKHFDMNLKHQLEEERNLWKKNYETINKNLEKEKAWFQMKERKQEQQKQNQWQEEEVWQEQQKQRIQKQTEQDEKQKQIEKEGKEQQKQMQQQLEAWEQKIKEQGVPLEKGQQMRQVQKEVKHLELESIWKKEEKQRPLRNVEDQERQWQKTGKDQMKIREENSEELKTMFSHTSVALSPRKKNIWKDAFQLYKTQEFHVNLKTLESLAEEEHPMSSTPPTSTQSSSHEPFPTSGQSPTKSIVVIPEEAQAQGFTPISQQAQRLGITVTPEQAQEQGITVTPEWATALGITVTPEQAIALGITVTPQQAQAFGVTVTPQQAHAQGITLTPQQAQAFEITVTPQQAQALGVTVTPKQAQAQGITVTPQQDQAQGIILTPEQAQAIGFILTPQQAQALGVTVTPEQAQAQGITVTPEQAQALGVTVTPQQAQALGVTVTPQQAQALGVTVTPQQAQALGVTVTPEQAQAQGITVTPQLALAQGITVTPEQAQALGITLTLEQPHALGVTLTPEQPHALGVKVTPEQSQALEVTVTPEQAQAAGIILTPEQAQALGITLTPEQPQALGVTLTPEQAQAVGIILTPEQPQALGVTLTPEQAQAVGIILTPEQAQALGITLTPEQAQALGVTLTPEQAQARGITLTPEQAHAFGITLTPEQAHALGVTLTPEQPHALGVTVTPEQAHAFGITLTPEQPHALGVTVTPEQAQAQGITLTPEQPQAFEVTLTPEQAQALGITLTPEQAQARGITVTPEQAQARGITLTPEQAHAFGITVTPEQAQALGITVIPEQAQALGVTLTPKQAQALGNTLTPEQAQAREITLSPEESMAQGITLTPQQAQVLGITLTPLQAQAQGITLTTEQFKALVVNLTPEKSQGLGVMLTHEQVQALRSPLTLEQDWTLKAPITPNQGQTLKAPVTSEQTWAKQIPVTTQQAQISGVPITQGQDKALGVTITPQQTQTLLDLLPEQAQALVFTLPPEKVQTLGITCSREQTQAVGVTLTSEQEQTLGVPLTLDQAQALETSHTAKQAWKVGVSITPEMVQEVPNILTLKQDQALGVTLSHEQAQAFGTPFILNQAQASGVPIAPQNAWMSAVTLTSEQTQALGAPLTSNKVHDLGSLLTPEQVPPLGAPFTPGQAQPIGITHMSEQDLKSRAPPINEQPSQLWADLPSGHTLEVGIFSVTDKAIKPSAPHFPKQSPISAPSTLRPFQESKASLPPGQPITSRTRRSLASSALIAEKSSIFEASSTPLQIPRSPLTQALFVPGKSQKTPSDPRELLTPQTFPSSRQTLISKSQSTSVQFLAPEVPPITGKLPISGALPTPGQPLALDSLLSSRQFLISRDSLTPQSCLIPKAPLAPRQPLISGVPPTTSPIPSLWDPLSPGKPLVPGASSVPGELMESGPLTLSEQSQAFQPPATCEQSPYLQAPSTLGQNLAPWTFPGQASPLWVSPTPGHPPTLWAPSTPGKPQKDLSSSVSKKSKERLATISSLKSKSALVHPSATNFKVPQAPFTTKFQIPEVSDTSEEIQILCDPSAMEQFRTFQSYLTNYRTPISQTPYIDEGALPTPMKSMTSLPSLTTQLPKTSQIPPSEQDQKFPPINKPCILTSVSGTKKPKMMVPPSSPQELKDQRYFVDVAAQRKNLILLNQATKTSGLPSELHTTARNLVIETLHTDTVRLGYLFRKYIAYRLIQRARNNISKRLQAIQNSGKGYETKNLYIMLSRIDDYQKKVMGVWTKKQKSLEQKRNQCLRKIMFLFSQLQEMHKLNLSQPIPLIINKTQIPASTKVVQQPSLELLIEKDRRLDIFKKFRQEDHMEAIWNADQSTSSYPIAEKTSMHSLWAQLGGYPAIPMLLQLDVQSTFRKSLASIQSQLKKIPK